MNRWIITFLALMFHIFEHQLSQFNEFLIEVVRSDYVANQSNLLRNFSFLFHILQRLSALLLKFLPKFISFSSLQHIDWRVLSIRFPNILFEPFFILTLVASSSSKASFVLVASSLWFSLISFLEGTLRNFKYFHNWFSVLVSLVYIGRFSFT